MATYRCALALAFSPAAAAAQHPSSLHVYIQIRLASCKWNREAL